MKNTKQRKDGKYIEFPSETCSQTLPHTQGPFVNKLHWLKKIIVDTFHWGARTNAAFEWHQES